MIKNFKLKIINCNGFSLIETIIAMGLFVVIASAAIFSSLGALSLNRLGDENTQAGLIASEGLDAVRSIKKQSWSNLTVGTYGVGTSNNLWKFTGTNNAINQYTRSIGISAVYRDVGGSIVDSGGTLDPDTIKVNSQVNWNFAPTRQNSVILTEYFTNWEKTIASDYDAMIVYSDNTSFPRWRSFYTSSDSFGVETTMPALTGSPRNFVLKASPNSNELLAGVATANGNLYLYCFDGNNWTQEWSTSVGGTATTRRFDIAYEKTSGKAVVLYSTNTSALNELAFRTKNGNAGCGSANWSNATSFDSLRTSGIVQWVKLAPDQRSGSNLIATIWADSASDLSAAIWNGTTFSNEPSTTTETSLEVVSAAQDVDDFDLAYESLSGDLMVAWANSAGSNGTNGVRYRVCTGGASTCTWGAITTPPTFRDDATNLDLAADPVSDDIVFASIGNAGSDLQIGYWNGSSWTNRANVDTSAGTPLAGTKLVASGFLASGATSRFVVVYMDSTGSGISWYVATKNGAPTSQTDFVTTPAIGNPKKWIELRSDQVNPDRLMAIISDTNSDLFAKRLIMDSSANFTWTNADGGAALGLNLGQSTVKPFGFVFKRQ